MAYSDFKIKDLKNKLGLIEHPEPISIFVDIVPSEPTEQLVSDLELSTFLPPNSEKSRSENIVAPILRDIFRRNRGKFMYYSGYDFNVDKHLGLSGRCDFLFSNEVSREIQSTVFCVVETKKQTIEEGIGQAVAEMYAAHLFNKENNKEKRFIYGCVTNGHEWQFLKLENNTFYIENRTYTARNGELKKLLGVLDYIINSFAK